MKTTAILTALALVIGFGSTANAFVFSEEDPAIRTAEGTSYDCLDYNVLYEVPGVTSPLAEPFDVEAGATWAATSPDSDAVLVDFFNGDGESVGYGQDDGSVPEGATTGIACVPVVAVYPAVPFPGASFEYTEE